MVFLQGLNMPDFFWQKPRLEVGVSINPPKTCGGEST
jgi:hypothetical protein